MAYSKVELDGSTIIDLTGDTAYPYDVAQGKYYHMNTGDRVEGYLIDKRSTSLDFDTTNALFSHDSTNSQINVSLNNDNYGTIIRSSKSAATPSVRVADANIATAAELTAGKLMVGNSVLGITGTATSDANATANKIASGYSGYVNGTKISGSLTAVAAKTITPSASIQTAVASGCYTTGAVKVASVPLESKSITANGTYTSTSGKWWKTVTVAIPTYDGTVS